MSDYMVALLNLPKQKGKVGSASLSWKDGGTLLNDQDLDGLWYSRWNFADLPGKMLICPR